MKSTKYTSFIAVSLFLFFCFWLDSSYFLSRGRGLLLLQPPITPFRIPQCMYIPKMPTGQKYDSHQHCENQSKGNGENSYHQMQVPLYSKYFRQTFGL